MAAIKLNQAKRVQDKPCVLHLVSDFLLKD